MERILKSAMFKKLTAVLFTGLLLCFVGTMHFNTSALSLTQGIVLEKEVAIHVVFEIPSSLVIPAVENLLQFSFRNINEHIGYKLYTPLAVLFGKGLFNFVGDYLNSLSGSITYLKSKCLRL
jgi:hypothetical protein